MLLAEDLANSVTRMFDRMTLQEDGVMDEPTGGVITKTNQQQAVQFAMRIAGKKNERGFIVFLNATVVNSKL